MTNEQQSRPDLTDIESALKTLSVDSSNKATNADAISVLAKASKQNIETRRRLGDAEALKSIIEVIKLTTPPKNVNKSNETLDQALRCIANACADNDEARQHVTDLNFPRTAVGCLNISDNAIRLLTTKVLYNVCSDFEPAQQACYHEKVHHELIRHLNADFWVESAENNFAIDLLFWMTGQKAALEPTLPPNDQFPFELMVPLLWLPKSYAKTASVDDFGQLVETVLVFLRDATVQQQVLEGDSLETVWQILLIADEKVSKLDASVEEGAEDLKILQPLCTNLTWVLSDIAALPGFEKQHQVGDGLMTQIFSYITSEGLYKDQKPREVPLTAACQVLGNFFWHQKPEDIEWLYQQLRLDKYLYEHIVASPDGKEGAPLLHSLSGLLLQLSRMSVETRAAMGAHKGFRPALEKLCSHEMPEVKQGGFKLVRAMGKECPSNQAQLADLAQGALASSSETNGPATINGVPS